MDERDYHCHVVHMTRDELRDCILSQNTDFYHGFNAHELRKFKQCNGQVINFCRSGDFGPGVYLYESIDDVLSDDTKAIAVFRQHRYLTTPEILHLKTPDEWLAWVESSQRSDAFSDPSWIQPTCIIGPTAHQSENIQMCIRDWNAGHRYLGGKGVLGTDYNDYHGTANMLVILK